MKDRVLYFDFLRLLATLAVVMLHLSSMAYSDATVGEMDFLVGAIYNAPTRWAVPCFVMLSGALFLNPQKEINLKSLYGKYILRLLIAYVIWTILYTYLFWPAFFWIKGLTPEPHHLSFLDNYPYHLWFLPMLIGVYMMVPLLRVIAVNEKVTNYFLVLWLLLAVLNYIPGVVVDTVALFKVRMVTGFAGYALLGYKLSALQKKAGKVKVMCVFFLTLALMLVISVSANDIEHFFDPLAPNVILFSTSVFVLGKYLDGRIGRSMVLQKTIKWVRDDLFGIYLVHLFYAHLVFRPHFLNQFPLWLFIPLFTVIVFVMSLFTIKLLRKIPLVRYVCS